MHAEFNSVVLFTVLYSQFLNCAKDVSKVTAQPTILEYTTIHESPETRKKKSDTLEAQVWLEVALKNICISTNLKITQPINLLQLFLLNGR